MVKIYSYLDDPEVYAIYDRTKRTLIVSINPEAAKGFIVLI